MSSDAELIDRALRGDVDAFGQLVGRYERTLLAAALAESRDLHVAEDVVQATLLLAFRRLSTLRDKGKFGPWLMQIVRRQVVDAIRSRRVPATIPLETTEPPGAEDANLQAWIDNEHLLGLVARLPEHERILVGLRYFDGHSMAQVAAISARPLGTVTKQLSRAIARLRSWRISEDLR